MIVESDVDWEEEDTQAGDSTSAVTEPVEAPVEVDDDDSDTDKHHSGVTAALTRAQQMSNFVEVPRKRCHCKWTRGSGRGRRGKPH